MGLDQTFSLPDDAQEVLEAAFRWTVETGSVIAVNGELDCLNLLVGLMKARGSFAAKVLGDMRIDRESFERALQRVENETKGENRSGADLSRHVLGHYAGYVDWLQKTGGRGLSVSLSHALKEAEDRAARHHRKTSSSDLFYGLSRTNHDGNRLGVFLAWCGYDVGFFGSNQGSMMRALEVYEAQLAYGCQLIVNLSSDGITVRPYSAAPTGLGINLQASALFLNRARFLLEDKIREFEHLLQGDGADGPTEAAIQAFLANNPGFLSPDTDVAVLPHYALHLDDGRKLVPDFILVDQIGGAQIVDLKLPYERVVVGRFPRRKLSSAVERGLAQLREYRQALMADRQTLETHVGRYVVRPTMSLFVGLLPDIQSRVELSKIQGEQLAKDFSVTTYDQLVANARMRSVLID